VLRGGPVPGPLSGGIRTRTGPESPRFSAPPPADGRSPNDETFDKLPFYAAIGCREIWVVDRDTRAVEVYASRNGAPVRRAPEADGWVRSELGIELRTERDRLAPRLAGDDSSRGLVP